jgi:phosphoglucosamine mutase
MRFGTDGVRGVAGTPPIDAAGARQVGSAAARWAFHVGDSTREVRVAVAHDTRPSGSGLADEVLQGVVRAGATAVHLGVLPTPALQTAIAAGVADVGVMVTASHNPASDNGFKVVGPGGFKPDDAETARLEAWMAAPASGCGGPSRVARAEALQAYADAIASVVPDAGALVGRRLVVDLAHGAATATRALWTAHLRGVDLLWISTGEGTINEGVGSEHPATLASAVVAVGADAGLAVDGDGDRALLIDATGTPVAGDALLGLLAASREAASLVVTVMSSYALEAALPGVDVIRTGVGDRHVAEALRRSGAAVGGEESGHALLRGGPPGGDGLLIGFATLRAAFAREPTLRAAVAPFAVWPRRLTKVRAATRADVEADPRVTAACCDWTERLGGGRVFIRWSGTEPVLRVLVEGPDAGVVAEASAAVTQACATALGVSNGA